MCCSPGSSGASTGRRSAGHGRVCGSGRCGWGEGAAGGPYADGVAHLLGAESLHLEFPTKVVFDSVSVGVSEGDRIGVVGRNGDGKSSLLAMLAGQLAPNSGRVTARGGVTIGVLDQQDTLDPALTVAAT